MSDENKEQENSDSLKRRSSLYQASRSEFDFISRIKARALTPSNITKALNSSLRTGHSSLLKGIGDDAAIIRQNGGRDLVITADLLVENIDFKREWMSARLLGHKALAVSLSDIAAMGARPRYAMLSIGVPQRIWKTDYVDEFYEGFFELAGAHQVMLIGGDVSRTPAHVVIDSIVIGEVERGRAVLRAGARPGEHIFVTGSLGGAAAGLKLLESGERLQKSKARSGKARVREKLLLRHLRPEPRVEWGAWLGEQRLATAMIDISDGLSSDLAHLCQESGVGARVDAARIPIEKALINAGERDDDALSLALDGGEDFELLFTVKPRNLKKSPQEIGGVPVTYIGDVTEQSNVIKLVKNSRTRTLRPAGFTHFY
ncbi:MAG: thiamine-phosphate kinase [Pyrinomonadaceae bacterium]|nr:thiamine-phosphate kinase [Pyrinomonadaceae bacterium]